MNSRTSWLALLILWTLLLAVGIAVRPLLPVDETRYVTVAWEMWLRGDFLVPYLNGEPYSHKPPLLFWLIQSGWVLFGVNDWWPRLVAPLVSLVDLVLAAHLARRLWPEDKPAAMLLPWLLFGGLLWAGFYTLVQFDLLLTGAVLVAMTGLVSAWQGRGRGWWIMGLGIGLGALAKGPVVLLHVLPVALLAPWWARDLRPASWWRWYGGVLLALLLGVTIGMAWAWPAAVSGGDAYRQAIFWGQHAGRMGQQADHAQAWWLYLALLPMMLLPWSLWPRLWRSLRALSLDDMVRFCLAWALPVILLFSLVGGKQGKYLLPMFPALTLLAAHALSRGHAGRVLPERLWVPGLLAVIGGLFMVFMHRIPSDVYWVAQVDGRWGWALVAFGGLLLAWRMPTLATKVVASSLASVAMVLALHATVLRAMVPAFDLRPLSQQLARLQRAGHPIATNIEYLGQYHFLGRLQQPLAHQLGGAGLDDWLQQHPNGYVIWREDQWRDEYTGITFAQHYRSGALILLSAQQLGPYLQSRQ